MSTALQERPVAVQRTASGGGPARRAIVRWSWRLFRREWRQQILVLGLVVFSVAATTVGVALAYNAGEPHDATFGSANSLMTFPGSERADVVAARQAFGTVEEIDHQSLPIPGSLRALDLRAQDPNGRYGSPTLRLLTGRYPTGADDIALTRSAAASLDVHVGSSFVALGRTRQVVGLVENPLDLNDQFALVAPGQADPPAQMSILFNATNNQVNAFHPGGTVSISTRGTVGKNAAAVVVLALEAIGLLFVGLVAAAGFGVIAQRRLRALGMLGALGATNRQVRLTMVANGAVVGLVGAITGAVIGLVTWTALTPTFENLVKHRIGFLHLPWWALVASMALAIVTAIAAAWWPARSASRISIVAALSGRPSPPKPAHRFAGAGAVLLAIGVVCLAFTKKTNQPPNTLLMLAGIVAITFGMLFLGPLFISALAAAGRRTPIALRLALRDLARYQARSAAALGAISLALAIAATVAISAAATIGPQGGANLPKDQAIAYLSPGGDVGVGTAIQVETAAQIAAAQSGVDALAATLHASAVVPLTAAIDPASQTFSTATPPERISSGDGGGIGGSVAVHQRVAPSTAAAGSVVVQVPADLAQVQIVHHNGQNGFTISGDVPLYVATPALLQHYGLAATDINANADIISSRSDLSGLVVTAPPGTTPCDSSQPGCLVNGAKPTGKAGGFGPFVWHPVVQSVTLPVGNSYSSDPNALLTARGMRDFGLVPVAAGWLIQTRLPLTTTQVNSAQHAAAQVGVLVETRETPSSQATLRDVATLIGLLVALGVLAMTVGLIRSETANDLRTLAATGATSTTRRTLTAATAGALALLGALLAIGAAYTALIAWHRSDLRPLTHVPVLDLFIIIVGLPFIATTAGWLLAGREPAGIGHQPLD